jgi:TetR/AcrR family transcriptional repressor of nem operon
MRYSPEHKAQNHEKILSVAARSFRERGGDSSGIGTVMRKAIIERYLSVGHANSPGSGCVRAALGPELARKPVIVRRRIEALLEAYRERFLPYMPGKTREEKQLKIRLLFSSMAGVLMMARVSSAPQRRERFLMDARSFFIKSFAEE